MIAVKNYVYSQFELLLESISVMSRDNSRLRKERDALQEEVKLLRVEGAGHGTRIKELEHQVDANENALLAVEEMYSKAKRTAEEYKVKAEGFDQVNEQLEQQSKVVEESQRHFANTWKLYMECVNTKKTETTILTETADVTMQQEFATMSEEMKAYIAELIDINGRLSENAKDSETVPKTQFHEVLAKYEEEVKQGQETDRKLRTLEKENQYLRQIDEDYTHSLKTFVGK